MLHKLNKAIEYIEAHLGEENLQSHMFQHIETEEYQFRQVFYAITGITLTEYIKNRRLAEASKKLLAGASVTDIAYEYGYQSIDGFSRAFKKWSGILPSQVSKKQQGKIYPQLSFVVTCKGGHCMEYKIQQMPDFFFAGVSRRVPLQFQGVNNEIVKLAQSITPDQREEMHRLQNIQPREIVNVSYQSDTNFLEESGELTHLIGVLTTEPQVGAGLEILARKAGTWAVFPNEGPFPFTLQDTMARIYSEWLLTADYKLADSLSFSFTKMDPKRPDYAYSEIWIPVTENRSN